MENIRKISEEEVGRIAEIIVFNNRINFYPIFQDIQYSFKEFNVFDVSKQFLEDKEFMENCYVYEDEVIKGFVCVIQQEIRKLYVDSFFQNEGIGKKLLDFAKEQLNANQLWALEKNTKALRFYERNGFHFDGQKCFEEGTTEYLIHLKYEKNS